MTNLRLLLGLAALLGLVAGCGDSASRAEDLRATANGANVLLVTVDSLAARHSSTYRYERETTPELTRLATESIRFDDVTAPSPSGVASAASLHLLDAPDVHGVTRIGQELPATLPTLADAFRAAGYRTAAVTTHPALGEDAGFARGFDDYHELERTPGAVPSKVHEVVESFLTEDASRPFFLSVSLALPTAPRSPSASAASRLLGYGVDPASGSLEALRTLAASKGTNPQSVQAALDAYDAVLLDVDDAIGRWLQLLRRTAREKDTLVVVAGLRGQAFGQRGRFGVGGDLHQEQLAVPLLVRLPGAASAGTFVHNPIALIDLGPSLVDLLGLETKRPSVAATSFVPLLTGDLAMRPLPIVARTASDAPARAVRRDHFKLLVAPNGDARLYHLERDPLETKDHTTPRPEVATEFSGLLQDYLEVVGTPPAPAAVDLSTERALALTALGYTLP